MASQKRYIAAIDQGTTGSTVLIVDLADPSQPHVIGRSTQDFPQHYPKAGWVEHDLDEIWASVTEAFKGACRQAQRTQPGFTAKEIAACGITNQRETICAFDSKSSRPATRAIVWQCRRSTDICQQLKDGGAEATIRKKSGLVADPYFSGTKIRWMIENKPGLAEDLRTGKVVLGTIDTYLIHRMTGGRSFVTEPSNACRTMLFNLHSGDWDDELLEMMGVPSRKCLPTILDSAAEFGTTQGLEFLPDNVPITGVLGDQQAALAGQACFQPGDGKCTYGTGAFLLVNTGKEPVFSKHKLLTSAAWRLKGELTYMLEGSAFVAGAAVQFLRDQLSIIKDAADTEQLARDASAAPELIFVPALTGLGAPHWNPKARGAFFGLTRGTSKDQLARAALEAIAFQVTDLVRCMENDFGRGFNELRVDGGASANDVLMQIQANHCQCEVSRPANLETTAMGAAMFAALGIGIYNDLNTLQSARQEDRTFSPDRLKVDGYKKNLEAWSKAVKAVEAFAKE